MKNHSNGHLHDQLYLSFLWPALIFMTGLAFHVLARSGSWVHPKWPQTPTEYIKNTSWNTGPAHLGQPPDFSKTHNFHDFHDILWFCLCSNSGALQANGIIFTRNDLFLYELSIKNSHVFFEFTDFPKKLKNYQKVMPKWGLAHGGPCLN